MTRLQAREALIALGIAEPTDENITSYLNTINAETSKYREKANSADELQKQLDEINKQNMSDIEKANAERDTALKDMETLKATIKTMQIKTDLATQGITGEVADKLIESLNSGSFDASILGQIISDREKSAIASFEKKLLDETPNPNGGSSKDDKTDAEKIAVELGKQSSESSKDSASIIDSYIN